MFFLFYPGYCNIVELLLSRGASVDALSNRGTPLHLAATNGHHQTVKILLEHHADVYNAYHFCFCFRELICIDSLFFILSATWIDNLWQLIIHFFVPLYSITIITLGSLTPLSSGLVLP